MVGALVADKTEVGTVGAEIVAAGSPEVVGVLETVGDSADDVMVTVVSTGLLAVVAGGGSGATLVGVSSTLKNITRYQCTNPCRQ